jgi:thioredoxin reductase
VLVIDAGLRRNRFASASHGFLGQDGVDPNLIARQARGQLEKYPTLTWIDGEAVSMTGERDGFVVGTADGQQHLGRRILFASGVKDLLPEIAGLAERWGRTVFHCPYCHGYELNQGRIGVIGTGPMSAHQAQFLTEWGTVTLLTNGVVPLEPEARQALLNKGVVIDDTLIAAIEGEADVLLADGRLLSFAGLFTAAKVTPSSTLLVQAGCATDEGPIGNMIRVDASKRTTVPGIFACGDAAQMPHSLSIAVGDGALAGLHIHRSLVWGDTDT